MDFFGKTQLVCLSDESSQLEPLGVPQKCIAGWVLL